MGLVTSEMSYPAKYFASSVRQAILTLVKQEQERIDNMEIKKASLSEMWNQIPFVTEGGSKSEKMQLLHGTGPTTNKIKEMIMY